MKRSIHKRDEADFQLFGNRHKPYTLKGVFWHNEPGYDRRMTSKMATSDEALEYARQWGIEDLPEALCGDAQPATATA